MNRSLSVDPLPNLLHSLIPNALHPFLLLSYPVTSSPTFLSTLNPFQTTSTRILYDQGFRDVYFVAFCAVAFTLLREVVVRYLLRSFAWAWLNSGRRKQGERTTKRDLRAREHKATRFAEQGWSFCYVTIFWSLGMVSSPHLVMTLVNASQTVLGQIPNSTSPEQLWGTYPPILLPALTKFYYLAQLGWWCHQIYVIHSEKRRNDHWQMFAHHILSITLITTSYLGHFTRVGTLIHVLMDFCDIILPVGLSLDIEI